jgi:outer membrane usher protein FimD/PapC
MSLAKPFLGTIMAGLLWAGQAVGGTEYSSELGAPPAGPYNLSYDHDHWSDAFSVFQMSIADQLGSFHSSMAASDDPLLRPLTRLDSSFDMSAPVIHAPLRIGDTVSSSGFWDDPVRMGGLQIGTLQPVLPAIVAPTALFTPDMLTLPGSASTSALLPAGYIATASSRFIANVNTDSQLQTQTLVAAGQTGYSLEMGRIREDFEFRSNNYGSWMTSGTFRYGLNADTTVDAQFAQLGAEQSVLGVGLLEELGSLGQVSARVADSHDADGSGWLARMGYDYSHDNLSFALRTHLQSSVYQSVNDLAAVEPMRQRTLASAGFNLGFMGKVSVASATQTFVDDTRRDVVALSHSMPLAGGGVISTAAAYAPGQFANSALLVSLRFPFDYWAAPSRKLAEDVDIGLDKTISDALNGPRQPLGLVPVNSFNSR